MKMTKDFRDSNLKKENLKGLPQTTLKKKLGIYNIQQHINYCVPKGEVTVPSLNHYPNMELIFNIHCDTEDRSKTKLNIFSDKNPYEMKQEIKIKFPADYAIGAIDRSGYNDQSKNKIAVFGLVAHPSIGVNTLVMIKLEDDGTLKHYKSKKYNETDLLKCIIVSDSCLLTFRP